MVRPTAAATVVDYVAGLRDRATGSDVGPRSRGKPRR
jgi:hypothetical protein